MSEAEGKLREGLGAEVVDQLGALSTEELAHLAATLDATCAAQSAAIQAAADGTVSKLPRLLRPGAKKILFG